MIWGLDTATRCTGITAGDGADRPACGVWTFDHCGDDIGQLLFEFDGFMTSLSRDRGMPTAVIFEAPILKPHDNLLKLRKLYSMAAHVEFWCRRNGVLCQEESAKGLKKTLTGNAFAEKGEMVAVCRRLGFTLPAGEAAKDAADSFAAWLVGVRYHGDRAHLTKWDQALYSRRGFIV